MNIWWFLIATEALFVACDVLGRFLGVSAQFIGMADGAVLFPLLMFALLLGAEVLSGERL